MGPEGEGGREGGPKVKAGPTGSAPLKGGWGREGVPTLSRTHPWLGLQQRRRGETLGETVGCGGMEGKGASAFPVHLGTGKPVRLPGLILCPWSLPPATEPKPHPYTPPRAPPLHLETPSTPLAHPHSGPYLQTPELHTREALLSTCCPSPSEQILSRGPTPCLNVPHLGPTPRPFLTAWILSLGPAPCLKSPPNPPRSCPTLNPTPA